MGFAPQTPLPPAAGGFIPKLPASGGEGSAPKPPPKPLLPVEKFWLYTPL